MAQFKVILRHFSGGTEDKYEKPVMTADHLVETGIRAPTYAVVLLILGCDIWFKINNVSQCLRVAEFLASYKEVGCSNAHCWFSFCL